MNPTTARPDDRPGTRTKLPSLTGMRFIAALLVFLFHVAVTRSPIPPFAPLTPYANAGLGQALSWAFGTFGYIGVSFFFVLSGFVLTWSSKVDEPATAFWRRRVLKIYPNHVVMWAMAMILFAGAITAPSAWLPNLLLIHSYFPSLSMFFSVNEPSWTLCAEMLFYLLFPFLVRPIRKIADNRLWLWIGVVLACMVAVPIVATLAVPGLPKFAGSSISLPQFWFGYIFPPMRLFEFVLGVLLARLVRSGRWPRVSVLQAAGLAVIGYFASLFVGIPYQFNVAMILPIAALICAGAAADMNGVRSWLGSRMMRWLGDVSFGFYMCQGVILFYGRWLLGPERFYSVPVGTALLIGLFAATLVAGWLLFVCVERPIMRRWSYSKRRRLARAAVPAPATPTVDPVP